MAEKTPRPAALSEPNRAGDGRIPGQECRFPNSTIDPKIIAGALQRGAVITLGRHQFSITLENVQSLLKRAFRFDDEYRRSQLLGPTVICMHWFWFAGRQTRLNRMYPVTSLRTLISTCFDLSFDDLPMDAVLAGMIDRDLDMQRIAVGQQGPFNWRTNIRGHTHLPNDPSRLLPLRALGLRGCLPPVKIEFWESDK
jgi:hypothetical protein